MKTQIYLIIITLLFASACTNKQKEITTEFLSNFEEAELDFIFEPDYFKTAKEYEIIDKKYLALFTDTTNLLQTNNEGDTLSYTYFYYVNKISLPDKDFNLIIIANKPFELHEGVGDMPLEFKLYTITDEGEKISEIVFAKAPQNISMDYSFNENYTIGFINKKLEIETQFIEIFGETNEESFSKTNISTKYKIDKNGNINEIEILETKEEIVNEEYLNPVNEVNLTNFMERENVVLVKGPYIITGNYSTFIYFNVENINKQFIQPDGSLSAETVAFAVPYKTEKQNSLTKSIQEIKIDIINNDNIEKQYLIKFKDENVFDTENTEILARLIDDYEIVNQSPIIAYFTDFSLGDFEHYGFMTDLGYPYDFNQNNDNDSYQFANFDEEYGEPIANPKYVGKKFKIHFHYETIINEYDGGGEYDYYFIDKIELVD